MTRERTQDDVKQNTQVETNEGSANCQPESDSAARADMFISDVHFPCGKDDLIRHAANRGAPDDVLEFLERFPEKQYGSTIDLATATRAAMH
jgi:hypothetical protein